MASYNTMNAPFRPPFQQPGYMPYPDPRTLRKLSQLMYLKCKVPNFPQMPMDAPASHRTSQKSSEGDYYAKPSKKVKAEATENFNVSNVIPHIPYKKEEEEINVKVNNDEASDSNSFNVKQEDTNSCNSGPCCVSTNESSLSAIHGPDSLTSLDSKPLSEAEIQTATMELTQERTDYATLFQEMQDNLMDSMRKQLEFLNMMKEMNKPKYAMLCPVLDKINPLVAGVMMKKSKIDEKTLEVMRRSNNLLKAGPVQRNPQELKRSGRDVLNTEAAINNKRAFEEIDATFKSESARKAAKVAKSKEKEASIKQIMKFILEDVAEFENQTGGKINRDSLV